MSFSENVKALREERHWSQQDVADRVGLNKMTISQYENGKRKPSFEMIEKLPAFARALGVTPDELSGWTAEHKASSFSYCMEQQLRVLGYTVIYDMEGNVVLKYEGERYEITDENLKELERRMAEARHARNY
jgi:transcriptional regulator with XRE-family HTH domain